MRNSLSSRKSRANLVLWLTEMLLLVAAVLAAAWLRFIPDPEGGVQYAQRAPALGLLVSLFVTTAMAALGLYQVHQRHDHAGMLLRLVLAFALGGIALPVVFYLFPATYIGRGVLFISLAIGFVAVLVVRVLSLRVLQSDAFKRRVLVLGAGGHADLINTRMRRKTDRKSFVIVGFLPIPGQPVRVAENLLIRGDESLVALCRRLNIAEIVVAPDERRGGLAMNDLLACAQQGIAMTDLSTFFEREAGTVKLNVVDPSWLVFSGGFDQSIRRRFSKRLFDLTAALVLLAIAWPVMLIVAVCVRLESPGPILYRQTRVGAGGEYFELVKFRSMRADAEQDGKARWASKHDDRTTRVGRFIRLTRLDELPQLFNVLRGEMSFVGPRPERPQFVDMLSQEIRYYTVRHCVKPGLTGWAQLRYPYGASVRDAEEKLKFDLFYVKNHGLLFDLMILLQTVEVVLFQRGAR